MKVQGLSGAKSRALEIACYYLKVAFNLNETFVDQPPKGLLLNLFSSLPKSEPRGTAPDLDSAQTSTGTPSTSMGGKYTIKMVVLCILNAWRLNWAFEKERWLILFISLLFHLHFF